MPTVSQPYFVILYEVFQANPNPLGMVPAQIPTSHDLRVRTMGLLFRTIEIPKCSDLAKIWYGHWILLEDHEYHSPEAEK